MAIILLSVTVLALAVAVFALYRTVAGLNVPLGAGLSQWPFGGVMAGHEASSLLGAPSDYSGFVLLCTDHVDALGAVFSASVIAHEWDESLLVAQVVSSQPSGWLNRLGDREESGLAVTKVASESVAEMRPSQLPVCIYLRAGRLLEASSSADSPSTLAHRFEHVVRNSTSRSLVWQT